jgi:ATP-dependent Lhr-like helicase
VSEGALPPHFAAWFAQRGWTPHRHQLEMLAAARAGESALLIAPTGGGKTLAGFLPSLVALADGAFRGLHTLYISPLKALAVDIHRNLESPVAEMALKLSAETRTGDTKASKRQRQRRRPPHLLMTTPESLALLISYPEAPEMFAALQVVIVDEVHALIGTKRGDLLALGLARLGALAPQARRVGLSATVADPALPAEWLGAGMAASVRPIFGDPGPEAEIAILTPEARIPWGGHMALHAIAEIYNAIRNAATTVVFVNTRAQAELVFGELWRINAESLPIALHHGSLAPEQRRKVEAAMAAGKLRAVVATSSLDLGMDWGSVDLVVQVGAPKGATRLVQRIGRSNHRLDKPSRAILVPANRFEVLECRAAIDAIATHELDGPPARPGGLDVLAQHILGCACSAPFDADQLYREIVATVPFRDLSRRDFDDTLGFVANGGYALRAYDRFKRLRQTDDGKWTVANALAIRQYRMNVGTIVEAPMLDVRFKRGRRLGRVEEYFAQFLEPGDSFLFAGQVLKFEGIRDGAVEVSRTTSDTPKVPAYEGGRLPLTTQLAARVRAILADDRAWRALGGEVREWLAMQRRRSTMPRRDGLLVETFPRGRWQFLVAYCFEGRNAHQTLGMLLTRRMERAGLKPLGFVASDYVIAVWSLRPVRNVAQLFARDMLGDDLEEWMAESSMLKRTFRNVAVVAGLIERRHPGEQKSGRQVNFNADLIYDVLRKYEPEHILLRATRQEAAGGLTDIRRLSDMLERVEGAITHRHLDRVSPLAVPVLLEIGKESVYGVGVDEMLDESAASLIAEATAEDVETQGTLL